MDQQKSSSGWICTLSIASIELHVTGNVQQKAVQLPTIWQQHSAQHHAQHEHHSKSTVLLGSVAMIFRT
jgi:hypothetical protein